MDISIFGGTGYAGGFLTRELSRRGHRVRVFTRSTPDDAVPGVEYEQGSLLDDDVRARAVEPADVVLSAVAARGDMESALRPALAALAAAAAAAGVRLGVVGGAGSLLSAPDGPTLLDDPGFPDDKRGEAAVMQAVLDDLRADQSSLDWFFVSPPPAFGDFAPGQVLGRYRVGGDVTLSTDGGPGAISGADFALAVADEIERPAHHRTRFTVAH